MEHVAALGGSLSSIATAKAGIMKPGRPLLLAAQPEAEADAVLTAAAAAAGCALSRAEQAVSVRCAHLGAGASGSSAGGCGGGGSGDGSSASSSGRASGSGNSITVEPGAVHQVLDISASPAGQPPLALRGVRCRLVGAHQAGNVATAVAAALQLRAQVGASNDLYGLKCVQ